jgi:hypothetical protein
MAAVDVAMAIKILNANLPTGAAGVPGTWTALSASAMKMRLNSTIGTSATPGTEIANGTGYSAGGWTALGQSAAATNVAGLATLLLPFTLQSAVATSTWSIAELGIHDNAGLRTFYGPWNGQPIAVAIGNTFQVASNACTATLG